MLAYNLNIDLNAPLTNLDLPSVQNSELDDSPNLKNDVVRKIIFLYFVFF